MYKMNIEEFLKINFQFSLKARMHGRSVLTKVPNSTESLLKECAVQIPELPRYLKPSPILIQSHSVTSLASYKICHGKLNFKENDALLFFNPEEEEENRHQNA